MSTAPKILMHSVADRGWTLPDSGFPAIDTLFRMPAFAQDPGNTLFGAAMDEAVAWHRRKNSVFDNIYRQHQGEARTPIGRAELGQLPWMFVNNFKIAEHRSVPREEIVLTLTSSGTAGQKTQLFLDQTSHDRLCIAGRAVYDGLGMVDDEGSPTQYLMFTYNTDQDPSLGTAWTDDFLTLLAPAAARVFLINKRADGEFAFDLELAIATYARFAETGLPVRMLGFPAFMLKMLTEIEKRGLPRLGGAEASWVMTGGGWKNHDGETISKKAFGARVERVTGVAEGRVRDCYGMAEHGIGYVDCEHGRFHVPVYARALTRDPITLEANPAGVPGILQLVSPLLKSYPSISLLTTDHGLVSETPCPCGRDSATIELIGRLGLKKHEGCAIRALGYLKD